MSPIDPRTEINLGAGWVNITEWVKEAADVQITRGYSAEQAAIEPSKASLTLINRDGRFSPRNPRSPYYGLLGRNTPLRFSVPYGETYLSLPGAAPSRATTPDAAVLDVTGDIDLRAELTLETWRSVQGLAAKYVTAGDQRSWGWRVNADGCMVWDWSPDGTFASRVTHTSTQPIPITQGRIAVRMTLDVNNGGGGCTTTFYTADSISDTWTQLGDPVIGGITSIASTTAELEVGATTLLTSSPALGLVHRFEMRSGIGGTLVAAPNFAIQTPGATSFADTTTSPRTWTLQGEAVLDDRDYRFHGELSSLPQRWGRSGQDVSVPVEAAGILRRLGQGASPLKSPLRRELSNLTSVMIAYWPLEEEAGATQFASAVPFGPPMRVVQGTPEPAGSDTFVGSAPLPLIKDSRLAGVVAPNASTGAVQLRFLLAVPASGLAGNRLIAQLNTKGSASIWHLWYDAGNNVLAISVYNRDGSQLLTQVLAVPIVGRTQRISLDLVQNGANIDWGVTTVQQGAVTGNYVTGTLAGQTLGAAARVEVGSVDGLGDVTIGHVSACNTIIDMFDVVDQLNAFVGETAGDRIARLCAEEDVPFVQVGDAATVPMGPQTIATFVALVSECAAVDLGLLYERKDRLGLCYRPRIGLYNQTPSLQLVYGEHGLGQLNPTDDDDITRNAITVTRAGGSAESVVLDEGPLSIQPPPLGVGRYEESVTINIETDDLLADQAAWRLHLGTIDEARYPQIALNLRESVYSVAGLRRRALGMDVGNRLTISGLPSWLPPDLVSQLMLGYTESVTSHTHTLTANCVPESPYRVATLDDEVLGRADTEASTVSEDLTTTETDVTVTTTSGPVWVDTAGHPSEFPFDVIVGGEVMTVTAIAGTTSPQTFTVTRSVNDVVKTHSSGADIRLLQPMILSL